MLSINKENGVSGAKFVLLAPLHLCQPTGFFLTLLQHLLNTYFCAVFHKNTPYSLNAIKGKLLLYWQYVMNNYFLIYHQ